MLLVFSSVPWINLVVFLFYAGYVHQGLGHWPTPMVESVRLPYSPLFEKVSEYTFLGLVLSVPLWSIILLLRLMLVEKKGTLQAIFIFGSGIGATWLFYLLDKHKFFDWWID